MTPKENKKINVVLTNAHHDHSPGMNKRASYKLNDRERGGELVQDTFLKTWKYLLRGGKIDIIKAFLYHVLNDLIVDEYRKKKPLSLDLLIEQGFQPTVDDIPRLIDKLDGRAAILLIRRLPVKYQKIMLMRYVQDLTLKEMSDINGQSKNTNAVQIYRAGKMLKDLSTKKK